MSASDDVNEKLRKIAELGSDTDLLDAMKRQRGVRDGLNAAVQTVRRDLDPVSLQPGQSIMNAVQDALQGAALSTINSGAARPQPVEVIDAEVLPAQPCN